MDNSGPRKPSVIARRSLGGLVKIVDAGQWNILAKTSEKVPAAPDCCGGEELLDKIVEAAALAVQEAVRDHKRAGNPIATWKDGKVVWVKPEDIEN